MEQLLVVVEQPAAELIVDCTGLSHHILHYFLFPLQTREYIWLR